MQSNFILLSYLLFIVPLLFIANFLFDIITLEKIQGLQIFSPSSLIDYGSGTGLISLELSDLVDSILLVDSSKQMLEVTKAKISHKGISNSKVLYSDFTKKPLNLRQTSFYCH